MSIRNGFANPSLVLSDGVRMSKPVTQTNPQENNRGQFCITSAKHFCKVQDGADQENDKRQQQMCKHIVDRHANDESVEKEQCTDRQDHPGREAPTAHVGRGEPQ